MFSEFERKRCERLIETFLDRRRPPPRVRSQLDLGFRISGQSVEVFEIRPRYNDPTTKHEIPVAKATFVRKRAVWRVLWQRRDLKWHRYHPAPEVSSIEAFIQIVDEDAHFCFWG